MRYVFDLDGVLCENGPAADYAKARPILDNIQRVQQLYRDGHEIVIHTARCSRDRRTTKRYLREHKVPYHHLILNKPVADVYVDDKAELQLPAYHAKVQRKPLVICYSGGMDSVIAYYWALHQGYLPEDVMLLNFNIGNNYADKEAKAREEIGLPFTSIDLPIVSEELGNMTTKDQYIIPGRNLVFATIAAGFGERVWIVGVKFEDHPLMFDKNSAFYRTASLACSQAIGATTVVESPFVDWTKTDMIQFMLDQGLEDKLRPTVSCYHDSLKRCGDCGLCFKRALAMWAAGLDERAEYAQDPFTSDTARSFVRAYRQAERFGDYHHYSRERIDETFEVLASAGVQLEDTDDSDTQG
jgi:7-cyano-7-deazaguanine synthase in queuosine biosynthesis